MPMPMPKPKPKTRRINAMVNSLTLESFYRKIIIILKLGEYDFRNSPKLGEFS